MIGRHYGVTMKHGKTAVYTILKNEKQYIEKWLYYADPFDYKVLLDTGSTDGSWELLQEAAAKDPKLIIEQKTFTPWHFSNARNHNMTMIPNDVIWCLSPDLDEYYSINTHDQMEKVIDQNPNVTSITSDRLDIYSHHVKVGPPFLLPTNKIHLKDYYNWKQPVYEYINYIGPEGYDVEVYDPLICLIHDQDFRKKERSELYIKLMEDEYAVNPTNTWVLWFLTYHYYKSKQIDKYIPAACDYITYHDNMYDTNYKGLLKNLTNLYFFDKNITPEQKEQIKSVIKGKSI